ncbi:sensor histidine kinase [Spirochaeta dissipatitropha]
MQAGIMEESRPQTQMHIKLVRGISAAVFFLVLLAVLAVQDLLLPQRLILILFAAALEIARRRFFRSQYFSALLAVFACSIAVLDPVLTALALIAPLALASESGYRAAVGLVAALLVILLPSLADMSFSIGREGVFAVLALCFAGMEYFLQSLEDTLKQVRSLQGDISGIRQESSQQRLELEQSQLALASRIELAERNRIARRIHDALGHGLTGALWQLRAADSQLLQDVSAARESLQRATEAVESGLAAIRSTIQDLQPREVPDLTLLRQLVTEFDFCSAGLHFEGDPEKIPGAVLSVFCDNLRELLTNTMRHSQATEVQITITHTSRFYRLEYRDNGIGMDWNSGSNRRGGMGLEGIKRRSQAIGGSCSFGPARSYSSKTPGFVCVCLVSRSGIQENQENGGKS